MVPRKLRRRSEFNARASPKFEATASTTFVHCQLFRLAKGAQKEMKSIYIASTSYKLLATNKCFLRLQET